MRQLWSGAGLGSPVGKWRLGAAVLARYHFIPLQEGSATALPFHMSPICMVFACCSLAMCLCRGAGLGGSVGERRLGQRSWHAAAVSYCFAISRRLCCSIALPLSLTCMFPACEWRRGLLCMCVCRCAPAVERGGSGRPGVGKQRLGPRSWHAAAVSCCFATSRRLCCITALPLSPTCKLRVDNADSSFRSLQQLSVTLQYVERTTPVTTTTMFSEVHNRAD
jgi:hypothetical protein